MPPSPVLNAQQRAWRYWFADGFSTFVAGLGCPLIAFFILYTRDRRVTPLSILVTLIVLFAYGAIILRQRQIVEWLKSKITYPRTGFALPPDLSGDSSGYPGLTVLSLQDAECERLFEAERLYADRTRRMLVMCAAMLLAMFGTMLIPNRWICVAAGIVTSIGLWIGTRKEQPLSWLVLAGFPVVGIGMALFVAGHVVGPDRGAYFLASSGALFFLEGALTLVGYLRRNPMPKQTQA
jgi:hypothetical protein